MTGNWTAIIVNYNGALFLEPCLSAIRRVLLEPSHVLVVDNASDDDSLLEMNAFPWATTISLEINRGFSGGANAGLALVETDYAVVLNPDVEIESGFGEELIRVFEERPRLGVAGSLLLYPDGTTIQHAGGNLDSERFETNHRGYGEPLGDEYKSPIAIDFATGAAMGLRMEAVRQIGGFDEEFVPVYYEDVDLCVRMRERGWEVRYQPQLRALHHEGVTLQRSPLHYLYLHRNRLQFALKHLSATDWRRDFVPAEIERLRHEFATVERTDAWPETSGAGAIDALMRFNDVWLGSDMLSNLHADILIAGQESLDWAAANWELDFEPRTSRIPLLNQIRSLMNRPMISALRQQKAFNEAVLKTLEAQERINREQLATTLLFALLALKWPRDATNPSARIDQLPEW